MKVSKTLQFTFVLVVFLLFVKTDFRIINELRCCQDDFDYYSHAATIAKDFDFDYSNQINSTNRFYVDGKVAPIGFLGAGLLASPFLWVGTILDSILGINQDILTFEKLIYSFSSITYLFISFFLIKRTFNINNDSYYYPLAYFGTGLAYFAFERYSMTHVYEVFTVSLIFYFTKKYYQSQSNSNIYSILLPVAFLLAFLVRWTNYYIVFLPYIFYKLYFDEDSPNKLTKDYKFYLSSVTCFGIFGFLSKAIYGKLLFSPTYIYGAQNVANNLTNELTNNLFNLILNFLKDVLNVMFTQEFGIIWFSPVLFIGFIMTIFNLIFCKKNKKIAYFLVFISFLQCLFIVSIWNTTASSYGFRYLYSLIPLAFLIISTHKKNKYDYFITKYLNYVSLFSLLSILFFETTPGTQLSLIPVTNSFGIEAAYSQPNYLSGYIESVFNLESYLKIFATSMLGSIIFKVIITIIGQELFLKYLDSLGSVSSNNDFLDLINKIETITFDKFIFVILFSSLLIYFFNKKVLKN